METSDIITLLAIFLSPFFAVIASQYLQNQKIKKEKKYRVFLALFAERHLRDLSPFFVQSLNQVPLVFRKDKKVVQCYETYLDLLETYSLNEKKADNAQADLLFAIAQNLGHRKVKQTSFDKYYLPRGLYERVMGEQIFYQAYYADYLKRLQDES